jgi:hypothetical protein
MKQQQGNQQKMYSQTKMTVTTTLMTTMPSEVEAVAVQQHTSSCKPATARSLAGKYARLQQRHMQQAQQHQALQETALATDQVTNQAIIMLQQQQHLQGLTLPLTMQWLVKAVHRSASMSASSTSASSSMQRQPQPLLAHHLA